jgi:hypothetical protein
MKMLVTYNSKHDVYGNRRNLVVNHDTKEIYYSGGHVFDLGTVHSDCGIREVDRMKKEYLAEGYKSVPHSTANLWYKYL